MRETAKNLLLLSASLALTLAVSEVAMRVLDLAPTPRQRVAQPVAPADERGGDGDEAATRFLIHPYQGWITTPGEWDEGAFVARWSSIFPDGRVTDWPVEHRNVNRFGFTSAYDDYRTLRESDYVIGLFGGSVAAQLAMFGGDAIVEAVESVRPELAGRVRLANCSTGGFKQPQQLAVLAQMLVLGVPLDAVVNIDGLNEIRTGAADAMAGYHPFLPSESQYTKSVAFATGAVSRSELELAGLASLARRDASEWHRLVHAGWWGKSELVQALVGLRVLQLDVEAQNLEHRLQVGGSAVGDFVFRLEDPCLEDGDCWSVIGDLWLRSSVAMDALSSSQGADYVHFLQPNQYVPESKVFTDEELRVAFREQSGTAKYVRRGYPLLQERGDELRRHGVRFHDLTDVYRDVEETVYRDRCCHVNWRGYQILGEDVGRHLATSR